MKYWWVNNGLTFTHEVSRGYLWSPKVSSSGARSQFYDNMREVSPGDLVFAYAGGAIKALGVVTDRASTYRKPPEFGQAGANWGDDGWFVPVEFKLLDIPLRPKDHLEEIAPLLPEKYSPLQANGNGNQAAYLASISEDLGSILLGLIQSNSLVEQIKGVSVSSVMDDADNIAETMIKQSPDISETEKDQVVKARRGQGIFRSNVEAIEQGCRITGLKFKEHLRASHIKPWRDSNNTERLDGNNGLLLSPHVDHLFDRGFVSFNNQGDILISPRLDQSVLDDWKIDHGANVGSFNKEQSAYLTYHRNYVFQND